MRVLLSRFVKFLSFFIAHAPRPVRIAMGDAIGLIWFDVLRIRRRVALDNLRLAFPDWEERRRVQVARQSLRYMGRGLVEFTHFPFFDQRNVSRHFEIQGAVHLESALSEGKGVFLLTLHLGNGDFAAAALSRLGYKLNMISKLFKTPWLNELWFGMRRRHGTRFIAPEKSSFEILKALKRNEVVAFVLDQFMGPPYGVRTVFFGKETGTAMGLAIMAARTRAAVIPTYTYFRDDGKHVIVFEPPVGGNGDDAPALGKMESLREENISRMTQEYTAKLESIIRKYPEQWMWIHRRWKEFRE